jgi:Fe-S oxidoreductase
MGIQETLKKYKWIVPLITGAEKEIRNKIFQNFAEKKKNFYPKGEYKADIKNLINCMLCPNMCRFDCGSLQAACSETMSPAYKSLIGYYITIGKIDPAKEENKEYVDLMYKCSNEENCKIWCPFEFSVVSLLETVRDDLNSKGLMPEYGKNMMESLRKFDTPEGENIFLTYKENGIKDIETDGNDDIFYYIGCEMMKFPDVVKANINILEKAGIKFSTNFKIKMCCGAPAFNFRDNETCLDFADRNNTLIKKTGAELVVSDCPGCVETLTKKYKEIGVEIETKITHIIRYISDLIDDGRLKFQKPIPNEYKKVVYHDPCLLARNQDDTKSARNILKNIPGLEIVEPIYNKENTHCCGWSGTLHLADRKISIIEAQNRINELVESGTNIIITACPLCEIGLNYGIKEEDKGKIKIMDISELISRIL